jgi:acyl-coenzyme A synthetase/AMP-(fatty) acid ligase
VYFGAPRPADEASASALAIDLQSLQADAFAARLDVVQADAWKAAWAAKSRLPGPAIVSFSRNGPRAQWSRRDLLALGACVARAWHRRPALRLACLLPKGVPRLVAEVACAFLGRPLLSLEPGTPPEICEALVAEADCDAVILSSATVRNHPGLFSGNTHWLIDDAIVRAPFWQRLALRCFPGKRPPARTEAWNSVAIQALQLYRSGDASGRWFIMPGAGPGWLSTWLPLLTDATLIAAEPGENTGWLADLVRETRVDTLVASGPQVAAWLERGEALSGLSLRRILTFDFDEPPQTWEEAENRWKVPVLRAWCDPQSGWLLCLEAIDPPRPFSTSSPQCGRKKGSVGRPLPGIALRTASRSDKSSEVEETAPEAAQPLEVYAPAFGIHHWRALPARGHIDSDGFVFLAER